MKFQIIIESTETKKFTTDMYEQIDGTSDLAHPEIRLFEGYHY